MKKKPISIEEWLLDLNQFVKTTNVELLPLLGLYMEESRFGWHFIESSLDGLPESSKIMEVGAGALILCCYVQSKGFDVHAIEPHGNGFTHFAKLRKVVLAHAAQYCVIPKVYDCFVENIDMKNLYDFSYSINVMEHVGDLHLSLKKIVDSLKCGGVYKFTCPNYRFPYEPHFEIPIILTKKITYSIFEKSIKNWKVLSTLEMAFFDRFISLCSKRIE